MTQQQKLIDAVKNNPNAVRLEDAIKVAEAYGFVLRTGGKHSAVMKRKGFERGLNFQKQGNHVKPYQIKQLITAIEELESAGE